MPLKFQPRPSWVVVCDFRGFEAPEMIKRRPVVVLARNRRNRELVTVVPLSTTAPSPETDVHHRMSQNPLPGKETVTCWAKCDMVCTVSLARWDRYRTSKRVFVVPHVPDDDFKSIRRAVAQALGLTHMSDVPARDLQDHSSEWPGQRRR